MSQSHPELSYLLALTFVKGIGNKYTHILLTHFGTAEKVFKATGKELKQIEGFTQARAQSTIEALRDEEALTLGRAEHDFILKHNIQVLCIEDEAYPARLRNCMDAPLVLYAKGSTDLNPAKVVAVIGTRRNTDYGQRLCENLIRDLQSHSDLLVVSGLASGIDTIAHKQCVALGMPTVGVLGHGQDTMYPVSNKSLAKEMQLNGAVLTEFPSGTVGKPEHFPARNRIVAGMSDVTVVVESDAKGGALITARMAAGYNRDVAAFPGRVGDSKSVGCNELIRSNIAALITGADDLLDMMNWNKDKKNRVVQPQLLVALSTDEQRIVDLLQTKDSIHADELFHHTGMPNSQLAATLLQLEMQGIIKSLPGKHYRMY